MRSLEWATSERNRASLSRRWRSSASDAPSTASETCEASDSSESTSSRGTRRRRAEDEQAARLVADGERQEEHRACLVEAQLARARPRGSPRPAVLLRRRRRTRGATGQASIESGHPPSPSDEAATTGPSAARASTRRTLAGVSDQGPDGRDRGLVHLLAPRRGDELDAGAAERQLARRGALLLADEARHARDDEEEEDGRRDDQDELVGVAERLPGANRRVRSGMRRRAARGGAASAASATRAPAPRACASRDGAPRRPRAGSRRSSRRRSSAGGCRRP